MKKPENTGMIDIKDVNFTNFRLQKKEITINGKPLPLKIGDRIRLSDNDAYGRTIMGITIHEDSRVQYMLEWHDPATGQFQSDALTLSELKLIHQNQTDSKKQTTVGFN